MNFNAAVRLKIYDSSENNAVDLSRFFRVQFNYVSSDWTAEEDQNAYKEARFCQKSDLKVLEEQWDALGLNTFFCPNFDNNMYHVSG